MTTPPNQPQLASNIANTLETASHVLRQLEDSLTQAGFAKGVDAYRSMCQILTGQRLWALSSAATTLEPNFVEISMRARAIHALIAPYADIMIRLGSIVELDPDPGARTEPADAAGSNALLNAQQDRLARLIFQALRSEGAAPLSFTALKGRVGMGSEELRRTLAPLMAAGSIIHKRASGRDLYLLATSASLSRQSPRPSPPSIA